MISAAVARLEPAELRLLGGFSLRCGDETIAGFETDKARLLFAYLALEAGRPHRRDELAALLWPDAEATSARQRLRQTLFRIRKVLDKRWPGLTIMETTRREVQISGHAALETDVARFMTSTGGCGRHQGPAAAASCNACALSSEVGLDRPWGLLLAGLDDRVGEQLEPWLRARRRRLSERRVQALEAVAGFHLVRGDTARAVDLTREALALEPLRERLHRLLMQALAAESGRDTAQQHYETLRRELRTQLDVAPEAETTALLSQLMGSSPEPAPAPARGLTAPSPASQLFASSLRWLTTEGREAFHDLAVFAGPFTAAEALDVAGVDASLLSRLERLRLVEGASPGPVGEGPRYQLNVVARRLSRAAQAPSRDVRERHAHALLTLCRAATAGYRTPQVSQWLAQVDARHEDLTAVLGSSPPLLSPEERLELAGHVGEPWVRFGRFSEGQDLLLPILRASRSLPEGPHLASLLSGVGRLLNELGHVSAARRLLDESLALWERLDRPTDLAQTLTHRGTIDMSAGDWTAARGWYVRGVAAGRSANDPLVVARALNNASYAGVMSGDVESARAEAHEALDIICAADNTLLRPIVLSTLSTVSWMEGDAAGALPAALQAVEAADRVGLSLFASRVETFVGLLHVALGDLAAAVPAILRGLTEMRASGNMLHLMEPLQIAVAALTLGGDYQTAALGYGAAEALRERLSIAYLPDIERGLSSHLARIGQELGPTDLAILTDSGRTQPLEAVCDRVCRALESLAPVGLGIRA